MGSFMIEDLTKLVELFLLLKMIVSGRSGGLLLERSMHTLVAAILFRMARLDSFRPNAQLHPPDGKLRQPADAHRAKRRAIVAAYPLGQAILVEESFKAFARRFRSGVLQ